MSCLAGGHGDLGVTAESGLMLQPPPAHLRLTIGSLAASCPLPGVPKHHICNANLMRNGADFAVYVNTAQVRGMPAPHSRRTGAWIDCACAFAPVYGVWDAYRGSLNTPSSTPRSGTGYLAANRLLPVTAPPAAALIPV